MNNSVMSLILAQEVVKRVCVIINICMGNNEYFIPLRELERGEKANGLSLIHI